VTLVLDNPQHRYPLACREDPGRLGVRLLDGPLAGVMQPMFQTSANVSGEPAPSRFEQLPAPIVAGSDLAIDGGRLTGLPSTVVDIASIDIDGSWAILREGGLAAERVAVALG
jgi:L-threonylcarbamoyladenylate synthase